MKNRILITGASGFVGSHFVQMAKENGYEVHAAVRQSSNISVIEPFVDQFIYLDYADMDKLKAQLGDQSYDYIIHAAALTRAKSDAEFERVNVVNTYNLVKAAFSIPQPPVRFVFVSSLAAIGPVAYQDPEINESNAYHPVTAYGRSKQRAEQKLQEFQQFPISIIRPTAVYGPREKDLFVLFKTLNSGIDAYIGNKPQKLSFIYVEDLCQMILKTFSDQGMMNFFNVSDGNTYDRFALAEEFKHITHKKLFRIKIPLGIVKLVAFISDKLYAYSKNIPVIYPERLKELTAENWSCDITKGKQLVNFEPKFDLKKGLVKTIQWYKVNQWL